MAKKPQPQPQPGAQNAMPDMISAAKANFNLLEKEYGKLLAELDAESRRDFLDLASNMAGIQLSDSRSGWVAASAYGSGSYDFSLGYDLPDQTRRYLVKQSRAAAPLNRIVKQVIKLWVSFTVGQGIRPALGNQDPAPAQIQDTSGGKSAQARVKNDRREKLGRTRAALDELWNSPLNSRTMSSSGVVRSAYRAAIDGELFFTVIEAAGLSASPTVPVRQIQALEIVEILSNPDDADDVWFYLSGRPDPNSTGKMLYKLYPDWTQRSVGSAPAQLDAAYCAKVGITGAAKEAILSATVMKGYWVLHFPRESAGKRGNGLMFASLQWIQEFRRFMVSRIGIQQAIHRWAHKAQTAGADQTTINSIISRLQSSIVGSGSTGFGVETNPGPAPGSTFVGNAGIDVKPMGTFETGASAAEIDGSMIKQEAAGMFPPHWIGDASSFRLATATALEMPLRAMLEMDQAYWRNVYSRLTEFALEVSAGIKRQDSEILIKFPALNNRQVAAFLTAFANLIGAAPEVAEEPESWAPVAAELNVEDPDSFTANLAAKAAARNAQDVEIKKMAAEKPAPSPGAPGSGAAPGKTRSDKSGQRGERSSTPKPARSKNAPS